MQHTTFLLPLLLLVAITMFILVGVLVEAHHPVLVGDEDALPPSTSNGKYIHRHHHHNNNNKKKPVPFSSSKIQRYKHRCIHDDPLHQATIERHLNESLHQHHNGASLKSLLSKHDEQQKKQKQNNNNREAKTQAVEGIRVVFSDLDLNLTSKYCTAVGQSRPGFDGSTRICRAEDIFTADKRRILREKVLPAALTKIKGMIAMERRTSPVILPATACSGLGYSIPTLYSTSGVANAEYVLLVSAGRTPPGTIAFAGGCGYDPSGRLIYGRANFGPEFLTWSETNPAPNADLVTTATHEVFHALGFTNAIFSGAGLYQSVSARGKTVQQHKGAKAIAAARIFFACASLTGVEMEDEGGSGSALSHPDKRILPEDFMAASGGSLVSDISIAMLCDLGHYTALTAQSLNSTFGLEAGCGFINSKCNTATGGRDKYWCFDPSQLDVCNYDFTGSGQCYIATHANDLPNYFQYFSGQPKKGGQQFMDYCPHIDVYSNRICNGERVANHGDYVLGHTFTRNSRCFKTSGVVRSGFNSYGVGATRCLVSRCAADGFGGYLVYFRVNGSKEYECSSEGSSITNIDGYDGSVTCPQSFATFCYYYDIVPPPPDGFPIDYAGSAAGGSNDPFGQVPTYSGAIVWIEGRLKLSGEGWKMMVDAAGGSTTPESAIITAFQRDLAGLLGLNVREVFVTQAAIVSASGTTGASAGDMVLRIDYFITNVDFTTDTVRNRFSTVQTQNSTAWLSRTRNEYQTVAPNATDNPMLASYSADYKLSFLERLFLNLGVGPFSGVVVAGFLCCCIILAIFFCFCKDKCCAEKGDDVDDNFDDQRHSGKRPSQQPSSSQHHHAAPKPHNVHPSHRPPPVASHSHHVNSKFAGRR